MLECCRSVLRLALLGPAMCTYMVTPFCVRHSVIHTDLTQQTQYGLCEGQQARVEQHGHTVCLVPGAQQT